MQTPRRPLDGMTKIKVGLFLLLGCPVTLLLVLIFAGAGLWFHTELESLAERFADLGILAGFILFSVLALYIGSKFVQRHIFLRSLRMRRLEPSEVNDLLNSDKDVHVIDLRHNYDFEAKPEMVPTAIRVPMEAIERYLDRIPKNIDNIIYCS